MSCGRIRRRFSEHRDVALPPADAREVSAHLESCPGCAAAWRSFNDDLDLLSELPEVEVTGEVAARVFDRLDMERRQPGLSLVFRPLGAARPLMLPSLVPAALVVVAVVSAALTLDRAATPPSVVRRLAADRAWGPVLSLSDAPVPPVSLGEISPPRMRSGEEVPTYLLDHPGQGTLFVETVVARDGSVSAVTVLGGDRELARPVVAALRRERYEPARLRGQPVTVSIYRLISRMEVWSGA
jgi:anti-sigma factor RsiW